MLTLRYFFVRISSLTCFDYFFVLFKLKEFDKVTTGMHACMFFVCGKGNKVIMKLYWLTAFSFTTKTHYDMNRLMEIYSSLNNKMQSASCTLCIPASSFTQLKLGSHNHNFALTFVRFYIPCFLHKMKD